MKKIFALVLFLCLFCVQAFCVGERYIIFFAENADLPQSVAQKLRYSKRFCLVMPFNRSEPMKPEIEELVSLGKIEPSMALEPEPALSLFACVYSAGSRGQKGFSEYMDGNFDAFENYANRRSFGMFLSSSWVSHNILYYFAQKNLAWIKADNLSEKIYGARSIDGVVSFFLHKNFPNAQKDAMKWLKDRKENFIPVLLTKKHLANAELMIYLIELFDSSAYIKPASPLFVSMEKRNLIEENSSLNFESPHIKSPLMNKLYGASLFINEYKKSRDFKESLYADALNEFVYLCNYRLLSGAAINKTESIRMFDAAYANIFRLLGGQVPSKAELKNAALIIGENEEEEAVLQTTIAAGGENSVSITNDGIIKGAEISVKNNSVIIKILFENGLWDEKTAFVDVYIDMNNFENAGTASMLPELKGFLSPDSAWEYAVRITDSRALFYRHSAEKPSFVSEFSLTNCEVSIPQKFMRGNPVNWGYQVIAVSKEEDGEKIADFLNVSPQQKNDLLSQKPFQIPAVRLKRQ